MYVIILLINSGDFLIVEFYIDFNGLKYKE